MARWSWSTLSSRVLAAAALVVGLVAIMAGLHAWRVRPGLVALRADLERRERALHALEYAVRAVAPAALITASDAPLTDELTRLRHAAGDYDLAVKGGPAAAEWQPLKRRLARFADDVVAERAVGDADWSLPLLRNDETVLADALDLHDRRQLARDGALVDQVLRADGSAPLHESGAAAVALIALVVLVHRHGRKEARARDDTARRLGSLEESARELRAFAGRVAHDLRGPLTPIVAASQLIAREPVPDDVRRLAARIESSAGRLRGMIDVLLAYARMEAPAQRGARADARTVILRVADDVAERAAALDVRLVLDLDDAPPVACEPELLASVVHNLVDNALKYGRSGRDDVVTVRSTRIGASLYITVEDAGPGFEDATLPRLFEPLFQGAGGRDGIGLGLAIVKRLVETRGGRVSAARRSSRGAAFTIELPLAAPGPRTPALATAQPSHSSA